MTTSDIVRLRAAWHDHPAIVGLCDDLLAAWTERDNLGDWLEMTYARMKEREAERDTATSERTGMEALAGELNRLNRENTLWHETTKHLMPYVQHLDSCAGVPCTCGMVDVLRRVKQQFEAAL